MPLQPRIWVLLSAKPKCVWKSGQPVLNSTKEISIQKRNGISICPRHGMLCSLAQHKPSPSHASHVGSKLRQVTCATRMVGRSLLRALTKLSVTVTTSSHRDNKRINLPRLASIFEEPGFVTPDAPQHQFGAHREHCSVSGLSNWMSVVLIPLTLPCRYLSHGRQCPTLHIPPSESAVEEPARAKREANKKASSNALQGLDQAPAKAVAGSLQKHF